MQKRSEETRNHLLEAAVQLFALQGYEASSVAEICAAAGVSKGAFYHHFESKQALFLALLDEWLKRLDAAFAVVRQDTIPVPQAVVRMADMAGSLLVSSGVQLSIMLEFWMQAYRDPRVWSATAAPYRRYQQYFAALIEDGIRQGTLRPVDPQLAARALVSLSMGMLLQAVFDPKATDWAQEARNTLQLLMDGMAA
jgi:TetR/AcrR family transcriptional regulator, repressor for uid operon